ncbi:MAG: metal ABC transporter solute-binding protein, Zn/Mn family [Candidatus Marinarcus sp.]|uniref:metal ABC transporter solute-binding protein, Zn/Mn family n=1 Tax=Candidatus Marinarcus sp. TaxID=3100987 RepID=UPI003B00385D
MKTVILMLFLGLALMANQLEITTSIVPQKYFVEKIGGDKVNVNVMVQPGFSPATYEPKTSQLKLLAKSDVYFSIGVPFEHVWLDRFKSANKNLWIVDTSKNIIKQPIAAHSHGETHDAHDGDEHDHDAHDAHDEHEHEGLDPHIWLDPLLVKVQAQNIYEALVKLDAKNQAFYQKNLEQFLNELDALNVKIQTILEKLDNRTFMVFHPSWGYFAKRYDLEQVAVEVEGKEPKPSELLNLIKEAKEENIKIVFVSPAFSQKSAHVIAKSINAEVISVDQLSIKWDEMMLEVAKYIQQNN